MRLLITAALLSPLLGCALEAGVRRPDPAYRSQEAHGDARWGMGTDELKRAVSDLVPCGTERFCREEALKGRTAHAAYELREGQLARVTVRVDSSAPLADFAELQKDLAAAYGAQAPPRAAVRPMLDPVRQIVADFADIASAFSGEPAGAAPAQGSASASVPGTVFVPWTARGLTDLIFGAAGPRSEVHAGPGVAHWMTPESEVWLVAREGARGLDLTLTSRALLHD